MENKNPQNMLMDLVKKSKTLSATSALLALSFIFMLLPWYTFKFLGVSESVSFFEYSSLSDMLVLAATLGALGLGAFTLMQVSSGKANDKGLLMATTAAALAGALNLVIGTFSVLTNNEEVYEIGFGYYGFVVINAAVLAMNGYKAYLKKDAVMKMANEMKGDMQKKMDTMKTESKPVEKTEVKAEDKAE